MVEPNPGDDFNALDPNILIADDGSLWLNYGSYWSGIKQVQVTGSVAILTDSLRYDLATRPGILGNPVEGASIVKHIAYYFLFVFMDHCCMADLASDDYKEAVGRSTSPHGPFLDQAGISMMSGGGTVLLQGDDTWNASGRATAYVDSATGESLLAFHAFKMSENGQAYASVKSMSW